MDSRTEQSSERMLQIKLLFEQMLLDWLINGREVLDRDGNPTGTRRNLNAAESKVIADFLYRYDFEDAANEPGETGSIINVLFQRAQKEAQARLESGSSIPTEREDVDT